jgi:hypothetical protein
MHKSRFRNTYSLRYDQILTLFRSKHDQNLIVSYSIRNRYNSKLALGCLFQSYSQNIVSYLKNTKYDCASGLLQSCGSTSKGCSRITKTSYTLESKEWRSSERTDMCSKRSEVGKYSRVRETRVKVIWIFMARRLALRADSVESPESSHSFVYTTSAKDHGAIWQIKRGISVKKHFNDCFSCNTLCQFL